MESRTTSFAMLREVCADGGTVPAGMHVECFAEMSKPSAVGGAPHELHVGMAVEERPSLFADLRVTDFQPLHESFVFLRSRIIKSAALMLNMVVRVELVQKSPEIPIVCKTRLADQIVNPSLELGMIFHHLLQTCFADSIALMIQHLTQL